MKARLTIYALTALMLTLTACSDFFDQADDDGSIGAERLFSDDAAFCSAMTDAYIQLRSPHLYGGTLTLTAMEQAAGTLEGFDDASRAAARHDWTAPALAARLDSTVRTAYGVVATCNALIAHATPQRLQAQEVRMAVGEAYGVRAAVQFDLLRLFHPLPQQDAAFRGLPYITRLGQLDGPALTTAELLQHISADLRTASSLLYDSDPLRSSTNPTSVAVGQTDRRLRTMQLNWYAVKAVEARVALWQGSHERVVELADTVFSHVRTVEQRHQVFYYVQPGKYGSDFCFSREMVFALATAPGGFPALSDSLFLRLGVRATPSLRSIYAEPADTRYRAWFRQQADGGYVMSRKFGGETLLSGYVTSTSGSEMQLPACIPYVKLGEVALMAAEALCALGRTSEALGWVEELEQTKDAAAYAAGLTTREQVEQLIADEYIRDLFGEGQLFYYQKRTRGAVDYTLPLPVNL